jgi:hypothetical protein
MNVYIKAMIFCFVLIVIVLIICEIVWRKYFEPLRKGKRNGIEI